MKSIFECGDKVVYQGSFSISRTCIYEVYEILWHTNNDYNRYKIMSKPDNDGLCAIYLVDPDDIRLANKLEKVLF